MQHCIELNPLDGSNATVCTDPTMGFIAMHDNETLKHFHIKTGCIKNLNKNHVTEKAVTKLGDELLCQKPGKSHVTAVGFVKGSS